MNRVRCQAHATVDSKGRLALPARVRRALDADEVTSLVFSHNRGAIWAWTPADFSERVEKPLLACDQFDSDLAGIDREVVINSVLGRIEIWDRVRWAARFEQALARTAGSSGMPRPT